MKSIFCAVELDLQKSRLRFVFKGLICSTFIHASGIQLHSSCTSAVSSRSGKVTLDQGTHTLNKDQQGAESELLLRNKRFIIQIENQILLAKVQYSK